MLSVRRCLTQLFETGTARVFQKTRSMNIKRQAEYEKTSLAIGELKHLDTFFCCRIRLLVRSCATPNIENST